MEGWTFSEEQNKALYIRTMDCPFFLSAMIRPIPRFLMGLVPLNVIEERTRMAFSIWQKHRCRDSLEESYTAEGIFLHDLTEALDQFDIHTPDGLAAFEQAAETTLMAYLDKPVTNRKEYVL